MPGGRAAIGVRETRGGRGGGRATAECAEVKAQYQKWAERFAQSHDGILLGTCREAVTAMVKDFPELREVLGHVECMWGRRGHAWAMDASGEIVDPTRAQFPGPVTYEPWAPGKTVRVGRCMNCGDEIWREVFDLGQVPPECVCSDECSLRLEQEFNDPKRRMRKMQDVFRCVLQNNLPPSRP
jgi:hypothetical protein